MMQFKTKTELVRFFADEEKAWAYLEETKWAGRPVCPHCGTEKVYRIKEGHSFKCGNRDCDCRFTAKVGSIFENSKIPLSLWYEAIWTATAHKKGISSHQLARDLGITQKSAWFMLHRIRELARINTQVELTDIVQVDETYVKGKMKNKSKKVRKAIIDGEREDTTSIVLGAVTQGGNGILKVIPNTLSETIKPTITDLVKDRKTTIVTDAATWYHGMDKLYSFHVAVNHGAYEYVRDGWHTNQIEGFFSLLKRGFIGIYHRMSQKHMQRYCDEFSFRYNTRKIKDNARFENTMMHTNGRLKYNQLIEKY
jgi:transposase-like protein